MVSLTQDGASSLMVTQHPGFLSSDWSISNFPPFPLFSVETSSIHNRQAETGKENRCEVGCPILVIVKSEPSGDCEFYSNILFLPILCLYYSLIYSNLLLSQL